MLEVNYVYRYLLAPPEECGSRSKRTYVRQRNGAVTDWSDFKSAFSAYMRYKHPSVRWTLTTDNTAIFSRLGYSVRHEHICKSCGKTANAGCCDNYSAANQGKRWLIYNMELVRKDIYNMELAWEDGPGDGAA